MGEAFIPPSTLIPHPITTYHSNIYYFLEGEFEH
jgi:hypothetical protein